MNDNAILNTSDSADLSSGSNTTTLIPALAEEENRTFVNRGSAADVWLIEISHAKYISKNMRLNLERIPTTRIEIRDSQSFNTTSNPAEQFVLDFRAKTAQWMSLQHENVVEVFGLGSQLDLKVEFCVNGTARQYLKTHNSDLQKKKLMIQHVLQGVAYLHMQNPIVIHGSLQLDKIFVTEDGIAKVGEFGLSLLASSFAMFAPAISLAGLSRWMSPELVDIGLESNNTPTAASDTWALGCTLLEIMSEDIPYKQYKRELGVRRAIIQGIKPGPVAPEPEIEFRHWWNFTLQCWETTPGNRPLPVNWPIVQSPSTSAALGGYGPERIYTPEARLHSLVSGFSENRSTWDHPMVAAPRTLEDLCSQSPSSGQDEFPRQELIPLFPNETMHIPKGSKATDGLKNKAEPQTLDSSTLAYIEMAIRTGDCRRLNEPFPSHDNPQSVYRRALIIAVQYELHPYMRQSPVSTLEDVVHVHSMLVKQGYKCGDIRVLAEGFDYGYASCEPTRSIIIESLEWLTSNARPGDYRYLHFSGYGDGVIIEVGKSKEEIVAGILEPRQVKLDDYKQGSKLSEGKYNPILSTKVSEQQKEYYNTAIFPSYQAMTRRDRAAGKSEQDQNQICDRELNKHFAQLPEGCRLTYTLDYCVRENPRDPVPLPSGGNSGTTIKANMLKWSSCLFQGLVGCDESMRGVFTHEFTKVVNELEEIESVYQVYNRIEKRLGETKTSMLYTQVWAPLGNSVAKVDEICNELFII